MSNAHTPGPHMLPAIAGVARLAEALEALELAAGAYGRGMAAWERGEISGHELGQLKRQLKRAEQRVETEKAGAA